jgi:hypothetical protein
MEKIQFKNNEAPYLSAENLNQMQDNIEEAINGIIESGSNDNGSYIKYEDGTMICHTRKTITIAVNNAWGSLYASEVIAALTYPVPFIKTPTISFGVESAISVWAMCAEPGNNIRTPKFYLVSGVTNNLAYFDIEYIAIGKWK